MVGACAVAVYTPQFSQLICTLKVVCEQLFYCKQLEYFLILLDPMSLGYCLHLPYQRNFMTAKFKLSGSANVTCNIQKVNRFNIWKVKLRSTTTKAPWPMISWINYLGYRIFFFFFFNASLECIACLVYTILLFRELTDRKQALKKCFSINWPLKQNNKDWKQSQ